jgi:hypothetical protein
MNGSFGDSAVGRVAGEEAVDTAFGHGPGARLDATHNIGRAERGAKGHSDTGSSDTHRSEPAKTT